MNGEPAAQQYPQDLDAECAILGSILVHPFVLKHVFDLVNSSDFYRDAHRVIYRAMLELDEADQAIDFITLTGRLRQNGDLERIGGPAYLSSLASAMVVGANVRHYAKMVKDASRRRQAISTAQKLSADAFEGQTPVAEMAAKASDALVALVETPSAGLVPFGNVLKHGRAHLDAIRNRSAGIGLETGFSDLDALTSGLHPGDLTIIAARTSQGKTAMAMNIALHVATTETVALFSLEMSAAALFHRAVSSESGIDSARIRTGQLIESEMELIVRTVQRLSDRTMWIDESASIGVAGIRARCHALKAEHGLSLIVVDYLQLVKAATIRGDNRTQEVGRISRGLKAMAKDLAVPVVALCQLNRAPEMRRDKAPQLYDLRESGDIENDADAVLLLWRPGMYAKQKDLRTAELIIGKQREGPTGKIALAFTPECTRFDSVGRANRTEREMS